MSVLGGGRGTSAVAWSGLSVAGRQVFQLLFAVVLARVLGPDSFGVVSMATIYVTLTALLLDQGLSAALIQRRTLDRAAAGATATVNLATALVLALLTWALAGGIGAFFASPELPGVLYALIPALFLKALAITPRALLSRDLTFRPIGIAETTGAAAGCAAGIAGVLSGAGVYALVLQTLTTDLVVVAVLLVAARGPVPNLRLGVLRSSVRYSLNVFAAGGIAFLSRNLDNILVGRFLGAASLAYYGMAYRVLVLPVQLIGQTVNRVMFPAFSRMADDPPQIRRTLVVATRLLSLAAFPPMALAAVSAWQGVDLVLGPDWAPAAPLICVLALAGARETVLYVTPALMKGLGRAGLALRFEILSTTVRVVGVVIGLTAGLLGVAVGYALAGVALTPFFLGVQRSLTGVRVRDQLVAALPATHASAWGAAAYLLCTLPGWSSAPTLLVGTAAFAAAAGATLLLAHRRTCREVLSAFRAQRATRPGAQEVAAG